ncbi:unnamed protein product, partial [Aphanomyces euteiches]
EIKVIMVLSDMIPHFAAYEAPFPVALLPGLKGAHFGFQSIDIVGDTAESDFT